MKIGKWELDTEHEVYIMGILNVTPDSFSDGGSHISLDASLKACEQMLREGAYIIDVGGESTRPGYTQISDEEEIARVCPVIEAIRERFDIAISLDTYKSAVADAGMRSGADMINDIWGLKWDADMASVIIKHGGSVCLMHNRRAGTDGQVLYEHFPEDVVTDLAESIEIARVSGIPSDRICIDPGIGFAKDYQQNLIMMKRLEVLKELEFPILLGTSRKSMIGYALDLPVGEREEGTAATTVWGVERGCSIFRVHNVKANYRAAKMALAMMRAGA